MKKQISLYIGQLCPTCLFGIAESIKEFNLLKKAAIANGYSPSQFIKA